MYKNATALRRLALCAPIILCPAALLAQAVSPADSTSVQHHIDKVTACLTGPVIDKNDRGDCSTLQQRMTEMHVPGVSIAVVHNGVIEWAKGFGVTESGGKPITADTLFQAGSISKPLAAMAALRLVQQGKLSFDSDVNQPLKSWKIPNAY